MANSKDSLIAYMSAIYDGRHKESVRIVTNIINKTIDKEDLIKCFRLRIDAANEDGDYDLVVRDCQGLIQLGFDFDEDIHLSLIKL
ncbi:unnamed protein product [Adineta steineri]|uniref:Uncharacterized protein n=1 Tax=Adineta steineri TaxID=433720 RepID=A0A814DWS5_9BILA|nr:unnamed protein product [Adineta steineri]CAF3964434.1 unnamed protein product [Adineta steineri]